MPTSPSADVTPYTPALIDLAIPIGVYRFDRNGKKGKKYTLTPNVRCENIQYREGAEPPVARFSYIMDEILASINGWPNRVEQLMTLTGKRVTSSDPSNQSYIWKLDDEIAVLASLPTGDVAILFHGFVALPQADLHPQGEIVTFTAHGAAIRLWDNPINSRDQRGNDLLISNKPGHVTMFAPCRFNPDGLGNMLPTNYPLEKVTSVQMNDYTYPVFVDVNLNTLFNDVGTAGLMSPPSNWTVDNFCRYVLAVWNDETYADNPDFSVMKKLLVARTPNNGQFYDPKDNTTYTDNPIAIPDTDITRMFPADAINAVITMNGFAMVWRCEADENGDPWNYLEMYRKDSASPYTPKTIGLAQAGQPLDPGQTNAAAIHVQRDMAGVFNAIEIEQAQVHLDVTLILSPGFQPQMGDEVAPARDKFKRSNLTTADLATKRKYRYFVCREGSGKYWSLANSAWASDVNNFITYYNPENKDDPEFKATMINRFFPTARTRVLKDTDGKPLKAKLEYSTKYPLQAGLVYAPENDPAPTSWVEIVEGWEPLPDRLGIYVTVEDPTIWHVNHKGAKLNLIQAFANPQDWAPLIAFRFTIALEGDDRIPAIAGARKASPTTFVRFRLPDRHDQHHVNIVGDNVPDNPNFGQPTPKNFFYQDDDTDVAEHEAASIRSRHEMPPISGSVTIPYLALNYTVGDRISKVTGRDLSLQSNAGDKQEGPWYPSVIAITYDFSGDKQMTILQLSDRRAEGARGM